MNFQNSAHSGAYGELCSASEHISYFSTGDNPGSISADGRQQKNRGSSNDEHLTWDGLINEEPVDPISAHFQNDESLLKTTHYIRASIQAGILPLGYPTFATDSMYQLK